MDTIGDVRGDDGDDGRLRPRAPAGTPPTDLNGRERMKSMIPAAPNVHATNDDFEFAALMEAKNYRGALLDSFAPYMRGSVLEIGAGIGQMSEELRKFPAVDRFVAVEPDERFLPRLRQALPAESILAG